MSSSFVVQVDLSFKEKIENELKLRLCAFSSPPYSIFNAKKKGLSVTLYESGKLVVQGKDKDDFIQFFLEPEILGTFTYAYPQEDPSIDKNPKIGTDEAGKGDFFGPLCVAALYADEKGIDNLISLGIADSKKLTDPSISKKASLLKKDFAYEVVIIFPEKYNELYQKFNNLNSLLAWAHATAIKKLHDKTKCKEILIDKFANEKVMEYALDRQHLALNVTQRTKGESDPVVAGASILARDAFVKSLALMEEKWNLPLPKGASKEVIKAGKKFVAEYDRQELVKVGKMHFQTAKELC